MSDTNSNWRFNIPIGSKIIIDDKQEVYIFYGYNCDKSLASCFPINSICVIDNMICIPLNAILSVIDKTHENISSYLETIIENKLNIN
jgi:hypothetical protein